MRNDIFAHIPIAEMTMDQLAFRRNGHLHDIDDHARRGDSGMREKMIASRDHLAVIEAEIVRHSTLTPPSPFDNEAD